MSSFSAATLFSQKNKQNSNFECHNFVHCRPVLAMQQLVALRALRKDITQRKVLRCVRCVMTFPYFTQRTQRKTLRCVRCVVKEIAPNCQ